MHILQICNKVPFPPKDGGCIAMNNLTHGLINEGNTVKMLAINTPKHFTDIASLPDEYRIKTQIEAVFIDTSVKAVPAFLNLFSGRSYNIDRFYSKAFETKLIDVLNANTYDIIQLESLYVSMYAEVIRKYSAAPIVLRAHNVEHLLWERNAGITSNPIKRAYLKFLSGRLKKYETTILNSFDAVLPITNEDKKWFEKNGSSKKMNVVPFGIEIKQPGSSIKLTDGSSSVFHIGAMDWQPNIEGVNWFLKEVWDKISEKHPDVKLYLAGRGMSEAMKSLNMKNVIVKGEVENAHEFMLSNGIMIAPLLSGGGMRVKIIEGMSLGKTVVTTTIGAEGIAAENNKHILIADTAEEFASAINKCLIDSEFSKRIGEHAKQLIAEKYDNQKISKGLNEFYKQLINK